MSLLKKLFGPSVEHPTDENAFKHQARSVRVRLTPLHRITFEPSAAAGLLIELSNISTGGMALVRPRNPLGWKIGGPLHGRLRIDNEEFLVESFFKHLSEVSAGCEFDPSQTKLRRAVEQYLKVEILALSLREVNEAFLKPDPRGKVHWFTDGRQNEFYCVVDSFGVAAFHMSYLGNYVEAERGSGPRIGMLHDDGDAVEEVARHKSSQIVDLSIGPSDETLALAITFVDNITSLPEELRAQARHILSQSK